MPKRFKVRPIDAVDLPVVSQMIMLWPFGPEQAQRRSLRLPALLDAARGTGHALVIFSWKMPKISIEPNGICALKCCKDAGCRRGSAVNSVLCR
jgi:hypothetical protein